MKDKWKFMCDEIHLMMKFEEIEEIEGDSQTLTEWLYIDVCDHSEHLEIISKILTGKFENELLWGNGYKAYVQRDYTEIHFNFEEENPNIKPCKLPTKLLREIVEAWLEEYEKFRNSKK